MQITYNKMQYLIDLTTEDRQNIDEYYRKIRDTLYPTLISAIENGQTDIVRTMVANGVAVNEKDIIQTICTGDLDMIIILVEAYGDITGNMLLRAIEYSRLDILQYLVQNDSFGCVVFPPLSLSFAARVSTIPILEFLLQLNIELITEHVLKSALKGGNNDTYKYLANRMGSQLSRRVLQTQ